MGLERDKLVFAIIVAFQWHDLVIRDKIYKPATLVERLFPKLWRFASNKMMMPADSKAESH